jgi:hypothetical protein
MGSSQIASTCHHDIHYFTVHLYLIMCTFSLSANPFSCWMRSTYLSDNPFSCWMSSTCLISRHFSCWMRTLPLKREYTKLVHEVLKLRSRQWLGQHVRNLLLGSHILEPHCSPLHHIFDIVIFDLDMLRPVME